MQGVEQKANRCRADCDHPVRSADPILEIIGSPGLEPAQSKPDEIVAARG
jgi:hypothetical protein